jgi:hypothetical protein
MRVVFLLAAVGCGASYPTGVTPESDNTLAFPLGSIEANRLPSECNVADPPVSPKDGYQLIAVGADPAVPRTIISISFDGTTALETDLAVTLGAFGILSYSLGSDGSMTNIEYGQQGMFGAAADDTSFEWGQGANAAQVDATPLDSATIHLRDPLPRTGGDPLAIELDLRFHDGGILHVLLAAPIQAVFDSCPAG